MNDKVTPNKLIERLREGGMQEAVRIAHANPEAAAAVSKLVQSNLYGSFDISRDNPQTTLNQSQMLGISEGTKSRIADNENITEIFPDIELAIQILTSSILSPKDMVNEDLIYRLDSKIVPAELASQISEIIKAEAEGYHKLKDKLDVMLRDSMFKSGSYVTAVIPENLLDDIINGKTRLANESFNTIIDPTGKPRNLGILGNASKSKATTALESFRANKDDYEPVITVEHDNKTHALPIEVTDNFHMLKLPELIKANNKAVMKSVIKGKLDTLDTSIATESNYNAFYKTQQGTSRNFLTLDPSACSRKSAGRPLVLRLPSEAVIPVHVPGDPTDHIGYFVLVDVDGNPVTKISNTDNMQGLTSAVRDTTNQTNTISSMLIAKARHNLTKTDGTDITLDQQGRIYSNIVETNLLNRLKNGLLGENVEIASNEAIYRVMLSRTLSNTYTRLIFIPCDLVTYLAFKYYDNGIGKSYLDDLKILTGLRAILLFAKVTGSAKNSINVTHVDMTLDPNDPDPQKTIAIAQNEVLKMRQQYIPLGINTAVDLVDWIQRAGLEWTFSGHPKLPQTKLEFESRQSQHVLPDNELDEGLRKQTYMHFGLSPEMVDNGFNSEFATSVVTNNILLSRRVLQHQKVFNRSLSKYVRLLATYDRVINDKILELVKANKAAIEDSLDQDELAKYTANPDKYLDSYVELIIEEFMIELPKPDITTLDNQSNAFNAFEESLEKAIQYWISSDLLPSELVGDVNSHVDALQKMLKGLFMRRWMADNGYFTELADIISINKDDTSAIINIEDVNQTYMESLIRNCVAIIKTMEPIRNAANKDLQNMELEGGGMDTSSSSDDTSSEDDSGASDDMGGDFNFDDTGAEDTEGEETADDTESAEETSDEADTEEPKEEEPPKE